MKRDNEKKQNGNNFKYFYLLLLVIFLVAFLLIYVFLPNIINSKNVSVSYAYFRNAFDAASNVSIFLIGNQSNIANMEPCVVTFIETLSMHRKANTISLYFINYTNCTYLPYLGANYKILHLSINSCIANETRNPSVIFQFSNTNNTEISDDRLFINGTSSYYRLCPIASEPP